MTRLLDGAAGFIVTLLFVTILAPACQAGTLRGKVVDARSKAVLPCRMYVRAENGTWLFAKSAGKTGSAIKYSVERGPKSVEKHVTLSADSFEVEVPAGQPNALHLQRNVWTRDAFCKRSPTEITVCRVSHN